LKGVDLVHCMNEAKKNAKSSAECTDAGAPVPPVAASSVTPPPLSGPDVLHVRVTDEKTGAAVAAAHVHASSLSGAATGDAVADGDGRFVLQVLADGIHFTVAHDGCTSTTVKFPRGTGALPKGAVPVKL